MSVEETSKFIKKVSEIIPSALQFDRLDKLAKENPIIQIAYAMAVANTNYALLRTMGDGATGFPGTTTDGTYDSTITIAGIKYDGSKIEGKLNAAAESWRHMATKLDDVISSNNLAEILKAIAKFMPLTFEMGTQPSSNP